MEQLPESFPKTHVFCTCIHLCPSLSTAWNMDVTMTTAAAIVNNELILRLEAMHDEEQHRQTLGP